jgi:CRP-like cAMP-binding protein
MPCPSDASRANHLLGALARDDLLALEPNLELVRVKNAQLIRGAGAPATHVYFPTTAVMSLLYVMEDGAIVELASIGKEGAIGLQTLDCDGVAPSRVEVRSGGLAYRIPVSAMRRESERSFGMYRVTVLYMQALMTQIARSALCTRHHSIRQQLGRWLLVARDQQQSDELAVTQQIIADMLGVRREGVTDAAGKLRDAGLIRQRRGRITVLDRQGLEECACECYHTIRHEFERLLPQAGDPVSSDDVPHAAPASGKPLRIERRPVFLRSA